MKAQQVLVRIISKNTILKAIHNNGHLTMVTVGNY
jgi:hypothetical protein